LIEAFAYLQMFINNAENSKRLLKLKLQDQKDDGGPREALLLYWQEDLQTHCFQAVTASPLLGPARRKA
jgi:hypothetical protein